MKQSIVSLPTADARYKLEQLSAALHSGKTRRQFFKNRLGFGTRLEPSQQDSRGDPQPLQVVKCSD